MENYYHLFANGSDARNFIVCRSDFIYQFNLVGISALGSGATVLAFSLEDTHLHALLHGTHDECTRFKKEYEVTTLRHICGTRGSKDNVELNCTLDLINDENYLMNAASYIIVQPTKDGKKVMPYDYFWGTGSMYFRPPSHIPIWQVREDGKIIEAKRFGDYSVRQQREITHSKNVTVPDDWLISDGLILPSNYIDVQMYEDIFRTPNCFRVFSAAGKKTMDVVLNEMSRVRGVVLEDIEARGLCKEVCLHLFKKESSRHLTVDQRITLGRELSRKYHLCLRQIATLCRMKEEEIAKYL